MKVVERNSVRLVFKHRPSGMVVLLALLLFVGLSAGVATITMHETLSLGDDFVRLGLEILAATGLGSLGLGWAGVRIRRLTFDARYDEVRYESRGLGRTNVESWPLHELVSVEIEERRSSTDNVSHITSLRWADGETTFMGKMDPPTHRQIERNVAMINAWLKALRTQAA